MTAIRVLLMLIMCLVTDAPGPVTAGVFEHLEDGEEIQAARRVVQRRPTTVQPGPRAILSRLTARISTPRPQPPAPRKTQEPAHKVPAPASNPPDSTEDH